MQKRTNLQNNLSDYIILEEKIESIPDLIKETNLGLDVLNASSFVKNRLIFVRHLEYDKTWWNSWTLTEKWKNEAIEISKKIKSYIWNSMEYELYYADDTLRVIETSDFLKKEIDFKNSYNKIHWLQTREKTQNNIATSLSEISPKTISFLNNLLSSGKDSISIVHRTNVGTIFDYLNNDEWDRILPYSKMKEWDIFVIDLNDFWEVILYETNEILQLNPNNLDEILENLSKDEKISHIIKSFNEQKLDSKYLQNSINYYFKKYNLYEKYLFFKSPYLSDFCLKHFLDNPEKLDLNFLKNILDTRKIEDFNWILNIILSNPILQEKFYKLLIEISFDNLDVYKLFNKSIDTPEKSIIFESNKLKIFFYIYTHLYNDILDINTEYNKFLSFDLNEFFKKYSKTFKHIENTNKDTIKSSFETLWYYKKFSMWEWLIEMEFTKILNNLNKYIVLNYSNRELEKIEKQEFLGFYHNLDTEFKQNLDILLDYTIYFKIDNTKILYNIKSLMNIYLSSDIFDSKLIGNLENIWINFAYIENAKSLDSRLDNVWKNYLEKKKQNFEENFFDINKEELLKISLEEWILNDFFPLIERNIENRLFNLSA